MSSPHQVPSPPSASAAKVSHRNPNVVAKQAAEANAGVNPLLGRLYSTSQQHAPPAPSSSSAAAGATTTTTNGGQQQKLTPMQQLEQAKEAQRLLQKAQAQTMRSNAASTTLLGYRPPAYNDNELRAMVLKGGPPVGQMPVIHSHDPRHHALVVSAPDADEEAKQQRHKDQQQLAAGFDDNEAAQQRHHRAGSGKFGDVIPPSAASFEVSKFRGAGASHAPKKFTYMVVRPRDIRDLYNPYDLQVVDHKDIAGAAHYVTVSAAGVTRFDNGTSEFIELKNWEREHSIYHRLVQLDVFKNYKTWKSFDVWRRIVRRTKISSHKAHLSSNLFLLNKDLSRPLRRVREICISLQEGALYAPSQETRTLDSYWDVQHRRLEKEKKQLTSTIKRIKELIEKACKDAAQTSQEARDDEMRAGMSGADGDAGANDSKHASTTRRGGRKSVLIDAVAASREAASGGGQRMSYIEQSQKRAVSIRLTSFIRLCDYLVINALANLAMKAVRDVNQDLMFPKKNALLAAERGNSGNTGGRSARGGQQMIPSAANSARGGPSAGAAAAASAGGAAAGGGGGVAGAAASVNPNASIKGGAAAGAAIGGKPHAGSSTVAGGGALVKPGMGGGGGDDDDKVPFNGINFYVDVLYFKEESNVLSKPTRESFTMRIDQLIREYITTVTEVPKLASLEAFKTYTSQGGSGESQEDSGGGADVGQMVMSEEEFKTLQTQVKHSLTSAYHSVVQYVSTFDTFRDMFHANNRLSKELVKRQDPPLDWFRERLAEYKHQTELIEKIPISKDVAIFNAKTEALKEFFTPSPTHCLEQLHTLLPILAREKNTKLLDDLQTCNHTLEKAPTTVEEFVAYQEYVTGLEARIESIVSAFDNLRELFGLLDLEKIPVDEEDDNTYRTGTRPQFDKLRFQLQRAEDERETQIRNWARNIDNQLEKMREHMASIVERAASPLIEDENANVDEVIEVVLALQAETEGMLKRERELTRFQESFGYDATPINELREEVSRDINDKVRLWTGLRDWTAMTSEWADQPFRFLEHHPLNEQIAKFTTLSKQVSRTQAKNPVVPKLKVKVDEWRNYYPIIQALKNPKIRDHHRREIDEVIGRVTDSNGIERNLSEIIDYNFGLLIGNDIVSLRDEIIRISLTATEEDKLESMLSKVTNVWQGPVPLEFVVNQHKELKDTYVLAGSSVEDVTTQLEDSLVVVSTIASSKYCLGGLKNMVDKLESDLRFMQDTLNKWLEYQRNWMYLENIFSSSEIRNLWKTDSKLFESVDRVFRDLMRRVHDLPSAYRSLTQNNNTLGVQFERDNRQLEHILASIERKLEEKRRLFPRFYFLSNDDLLDILSKIKQPEKIFPHLLKMFDAVKSLTLTSTNDITHMNSSEGEKVELSTKTIKAGRGQVESWLGDFEMVMFQTLRNLGRDTIDDFENCERTEWMFRHSVQLVLIVSQIFWTRGVEQALSGNDTRALMQEQKDLNYQQLADLADLTGLKLNRIQRSVLGTLITIDVHGRDLVDELVDNKVERATDFGWSKILRSYWETDPTDGKGNIFISQINSRFTYGYEYLGAQGRLVITPLTDRIVLTITGALKLYLGAAPAGPAGTGKTESTKDLAKNLARQCIVYNCGPGQTAKQMERFFSGLIQAGAWACLDEFNRMNIEVLSVIASQLLEVKIALQNHQKSFTFQGVPNVAIRDTYAVCITMNPGYAGRTELPDNLKVLFRPVAVMTPDFRMIAEVILYSEGFKDAKGLSLKITQLYKLSSEQLSPQQHYDFGMRALKSILVMAGDLKRAQPDVEEDKTLIVACNDSNVPKFVADDIPLFRGIMTDLFPGVQFSEREYPELLPAMHRFMKGRELLPVETWVKKGIQFYETLIVRHGVMIVGVTNTGKTNARDCIAMAIEDMHGRGSKEPMARPVHQFIMNPKSILMSELYGILDPLTSEWTDGCLAVIAKKCVKNAEASTDHSWIVFDGPVDTLWIESLNSVLDDSKLLCLDSGERIKLAETIHMLFEVNDLAVASPATVSRCGIVFMDESHLPWNAQLSQWTKTKLPALGVQKQSIDMIHDLFTTMCTAGFEFLGTLAKNAVLIHGGNTNLVVSCCDMFAAVFRAEGLKLINDPKDDVVLEFQDAYWKDRNDTVRLLFAFAFTFTFGGNLDAISQELWDAWLRDTMEAVPFPSHGSVFDFVPDFGSRRFQSWDTRMTPFVYDHSKPFFSMIVPTMDTIRYKYIAKTLIQYRKPFLLSGHSGVGKSVIITDALMSYKEELGLVVVNFQFSAQTSSGRTQELIESKLKHKRKNLLGAPPEKHVVFFVDDLNMPALEEYGASPPIELLRQMAGNGGFYDRKDAGFWKHVEDVTMVAACGPPEGGRVPTTRRLTRMFHLMQIANLSEDSMKRIFQQLLQGFFGTLNFNQEVRDTVKSMVSGTVEIFLRLRDELRPKPSTPHYTFNLRDISKVVQGIMQAHPRVIKDTVGAARLWMNENLRCFCDRLTNAEDRTYFTEQLIFDVLKRLFPGTWNYADLFEGPNPMVWGDFLRIGAAPEDRYYEEAADFSKLYRLFDEYLEEYNTDITLSKGTDQADQGGAANSAGPSSQATTMDLVFFKDNCQQLARIIRIIRQPRGSALLVGVGGSGKQSLSRLAASVAGCKCYDIAVAKGYSVQDFRNKLLDLYTIAGVKNTPIAFLINDTQLVHDGMLEDLNNILNSGEVPSLFAPDERDKRINQCAEAAREAGISGREEIFAFFIGRVRDNLHVCLCMSPVGDAFRTRCRQFPSLTNCMQITWFDEWPREALLAVAAKLMAEVELPDGGCGSEGATTAAQLREKLTDLCVEVHASVGTATQDFWDELRRRVYITPTSYLEFISMYRMLLSTRTEKQSEYLGRLKNGIVKMKETNDTIAVMRRELEMKQPLLEKAQKDNEVLVADLNVRAESANEVKIAVTAKQEEAAAKQRDAAEIEADASSKLAEATPAIEAAERALDAIEKSDLAVLKALPNPNIVVIKTLACCMTLFEAHREKIDGWSGQMDWKGAREFLSDTQLLKKLKEYDKDNVRPQSIVKLQKLINEEPVLTPDVCESRGTKACRGMCLWFLAMIKYDEIYKYVAPRRVALKEARASLAETNAKLAEAEAQLKKVEDELDRLRANLADSTRRRELLEKEVNTCRQRLTNAESLSSSLKNESVRWTENISIMEDKIRLLPVDMFLSAACASYFGPFTGMFRKSLTARWLAAAREKGITQHEKFSIIDTLGDPVETLNWQICSLPTDEVSTENAIIVSLSCHPFRWPLLIDPQGQATKFIVSRAKTERPLKIIKQTESTYLRQLDMAIRSGTTVLIDDCGETLDPALEALLMRQIFKNEGGQEQIQLTPQQVVPYDPQFRLFMVTKLSNPTFLPEVTIKATVVNFTVTRDGLEDQMLGEVVSIEMKELEEEKNKIIQSVSEGQKQLKKFEEDILRKLKNAEGNILDDDSLINELKNAQSRATFVAKRQVEAQEKIKLINATREMYRDAALRSALLFFVLADLALIDPMYQYSLEFYKGLIGNVVRETVRPKGLDLQNPAPDLFDQHLANMLSRMTEATYTQVCRGLFNRDKTILSLLMCTTILRNSGEIQPAEWQYYIRASALSQGEPPEIPSSLNAFVNPQRWELLQTLKRVVPCFRNLIKDVTKRPELWTAWVLSHEPHLEPLPGHNIPVSNATKERLRRRKSLTAQSSFDPASSSAEAEQPGDDGQDVNWEAELTPFQKMLLIRCLREEKMMFASVNYVKEKLGRMYTLEPPFNLQQALADSTPATPIIFILSQGADPQSALRSFATDRKKTIGALSLGQGQEEPAKKLIENSRRSGDWALLQNAHLSRTFVPELINQVALLQVSVAQAAAQQHGGGGGAAAAAAASSGAVSVGYTHPEFRLWLTSMPAEFFPVFVLQNSVKITIEPPTGLRANMVRCFQEIKDADYDGVFTDADRFENCTKEYAYKKLMYALCFYHSVMLERRGFGPLGWNVRYEFSDTDFMVSKQWLTIFLAEQDVVPWDSLTYIIGQINYGGRVTDPQDRITLATIMNVYFNESVLKEGHSFGSGSEYPVAPVSSLQGVRAFIDGMSTIDSPAAFGMHENASLRQQLQRSELMMGTLLSVQPRMTGGGKGAGSGPTPEEQVMQKCQDFLAILPDKMNKAEAHPTTFTLLPNGLPNSLSTVLSHELVKYNTLLTEMEWSLHEMQKALKGLTVLSASLDAMYTAFLNDQVPKLWSNVAYLSLKPLGAWFKELVQKVNFMRNWLQRGEPTAFWMPGFFNQASFMTGVLQAFARKHTVSVDKLGFRFAMVETPLEDIKERAPDGVYISGMFTDSWRWDAERKVMADSLPREMHTVLPVLHFLPEPHHRTPSTAHRVPLYRTTARAGIISSLGASSNFILCIEALTDKPSDYWTLKGAACMCALNY